MGVLKVTAGGVALERYLAKTGESMRSWCHRNSLDRQTVLRVINGERWRHITVDFALRIERATQGEIAPWQWGSDTAKVKVTV